VPLNDFYALSFEGDADYKSGHFFTADNNPALYQSGYWLFDVSTSLVRAGGIRLSGWVKNLADRRYYASGLANTGLGFIEVVPGAPRTFGLTLEVRY